MKVNINRAIRDEATRAMRAEQEKLTQQTTFFLLLAVADVLHTEHGFGDKRLSHTLQCITDRVNALSRSLTANVTVHKGNTLYDTDYNKETLKRLAAQYHIAWQDDLFE